MHARPMASVQKDFDGVLWFMSREHSLKIDEIEANPDVLLAYSHPGRQHYISINGKARIVRDRAKINELWTEADRVWFPKGPDDPELALLAVDIDQAEYWDAPVLRHGPRLWLREGPARGREPEDGREQDGEVLKPTRCPKPASLLRAAAKQSMAAAR